MTLHRKMWCPRRQTTPGIAVALMASWIMQADCNYETFTLRYSADPAPLAFGDRLYFYTSHDILGQKGWLMRDYNCFSTVDGVNFEDHGIVFSLDNQKWGTYAWAQQVTYRNGTFFMYYPAMTGGNDVGIATSTSPTGPFVDLLGHGIAPGDDPTVFQDDDANSTPYLCSNNGGPYCAPLNEDMVSFAKPQAMVNVSGLGDGWFEAPWLSKLAGLYMLSFMTTTDHGVYGYSIGYATNNSTDPLGTYTYQGLLQWSTPYDCGRGNASLCPNDGGDNNHQGIAEFPAGSGKLWFAYHNRKLAVERGQYLGFQRNVALDRLYLDPDVPGRLVPVTSTPTWVRQLAFVDPFQVHPATLMAAGSPGLDTEAATDAEGGFPRDLGNITQGAWIRLQGVDFGSADTSPWNLTVRVASPIAGGLVEAHLDSVDGPLVASAAVPNTGGWQSYVNVTVNTSSSVDISGIHDLFFVFRGTGTTGLFNFVSWRFSGGNASGIEPPPVMVQLALRAKGTGLYVTAPSDGTSPLTAASASIGPAESFILADNEDGSYGLRANSTGLWVCSQASGTAPLVASTADQADPCARWRLQGTTEGSYVLQAPSSRLLVVAPNGTSSGGGPLPLFPNATDPRLVAGDAARFWLEEL